jgi:uncharacterized repeat protein (TIGR01451 family)
MVPPFPRGSRRRRTGLTLGAALLCALAAFPAVTIGAHARASENEKKVDICHATGSDNNPYVANSPSIENNGDLQGGHLNHPNDIIPPYDYVDSDGSLQTFPGRNWSPENQAIWQNGCRPVVRPEPLIPTLQCVEETDDGLLAHFGYRNPNATAIEPASADNAFSPEPAGRGQPTRFEPGTWVDVFQAEVGGGSLTWTLTGNSVTASDGSPRCPGGSISVVKKLVPGDDDGRFDLRIDGEIAGGAQAVGDQGTTGTIAVPSGRRTISESAAPGTSLADYTISISCVGGSSPVSASGPSIQVPVRRGDAITCTIRNENTSQAKDVAPVLECVVFGDGKPDIAVWGYRNGSGSAVTIPVGASNRFDPAPQGRGQPTTFEEGRHVGAFQTTFDASAGTLTWRLVGKTATASSSSPRCTATLELRKVVVPATDPGVFALKVNDTTLATGGDGTTTGPVVVGTGEGTVSEAAGPGTNLADYDSRVECTRNGTIAVSVPGTKVDGSVAAGDVVICTFTNVRRTGPPPEPPSPPTPPTPPTPPIPPLPPPGPELDLVVNKSASPTTVNVGGRITWTMTVTNNSTVEASDVNGVKVDDPRSFRTKLISLRTSQGTCRPYTCDLGRLEPGATATVVAVTQALQVGVVVNIVRAGSEEHESNYRNNLASALARVIGPLRPPVVLDRCRTLTAEPRALQHGRSSVVRLTARNRLGKPLRGHVVRAQGAGIDATARTDRHGVARFALIPPKVGVVVFSLGGRTSSARRSVCRTLLGVLGAEDTIVTG